MKIPVSKEQVVATIKTVFGYVLVIGALVLGFAIGRVTADFPPKQVKVENPYSKALAPDEISIAVNESNELMIIERKTGKYVMYTDAVGMTIFKMYTNRIYQNVNSNE